MYKLMIVDDEFHIRDGIANAIDWASMNVTISGTASSSRAALSLIPDQHPDIVITDIYMAGMDGLELAEHLRHLYPDIKIIIISGYDDFQYAKRAIELKVFSYVLKPIQPRELMDNVQSLIREIELDRQLKQTLASLESELSSSRDILGDKLLSDLLDGRIADPAVLDQRVQFLGISFSASQWFVILFNVDGYRELVESRTPAELHMGLLGVREVVRQNLGVGFEPYLLLRDNGNVIAVVGCEGVGRSLKDNARLNGQISRIMENVNAMLGFTVTVTIGGVQESLARVCKSYDEALLALDYKMVAGRECIIHIDDVVTINGDCYSYPADIETQILESLRNIDEDRLRASLKAFFAELEAQNYVRNRIRTAVMELYAVVARKLMELGTDLNKVATPKVADPYRAFDRYDTLGELANWMSNLVGASLASLRQNRENNLKSVIRRAQEYISRNYGNPDISLNSIADHVYVNPSYFSKLYRKETGEHYVDYLTRTRMEEAKRLLRHSNLKTADIGNSVGYPNPQYFSTLFKKHTGFSPVEYRESHGK